MTPNPYDTRQYHKERIVAVGITASLAFHVLLCLAILFLPNFFSRPSQIMPDIMTIQLVGSVEPPAPAAPAAPVNPNLTVPDVVRIPPAEPVLPQPTPDQEVQIPETPVEVIPIGKTPPNTPPPPERTNEPPPKVQAPEKPPEPKPEPKPKPKKKTPTDEQLLAQRMDELQRKKERDAEDEALNQTLANLALERGRGDGSSSTPASTRTQGQRLDPEAERYYLKILEIVRSNWLPPAGLGSSNITATFVIAIDPSGRVTGKNLRISSGNPSFDASVEQAINRSQFPPLPPIFGGKPDNPALQFNFNYLSSG